MRRIAAFSVVLLTLVFCAASARGADLLAERTAIYADYAKRLDELIEWCRGRDLKDAVEELRAWLPERSADHSTLFVLPSTVAAPAKPKETAWRTRWQELRNGQAEILFALAYRAATEGRPSLAYELVVETVRENPDHKAGRRMLGYVRARDEWHTPFEVKQLSAGKVWTDKFGWLPKAHVERYEKGQRNYQGRWLSAEDEARLRSDLKRGWKVESTHYTVTTNHSLEEGVRMSQKLELLHAIWQQVFIGYTTDDTELKRRFDGRPPKQEKPHQVICYRTRQEYNDALRSVQPKIDITLGIYLDKTRTAYFFAGDEQDPGTLYHEATHQLFQETRQVVPNVGRSDNFWVVEGIACYMESLAEAGNHFTLGGANAGRVPAARHRLLEDNFYVPLEELVRIGMESLQSDTRLPRLYSQSAGLADFFMHAAAGHYRDPLVAYLVEVYTGRATTGSLSELMGKDYSTLDREYREFMSQDFEKHPAAASAAR